MSWRTKPEIFEEKQFHFFLINLKFSKSNGFAFTGATFGVQSLPNLTIFSNSQLNLTKKLFLPPCIVYADDSHNERVPKTAQPRLTNRKFINDNDDGFIDQVHDLLIYDQVRP